MIEKYGKGQPVSEATFFDDLTAITYSEIKDFYEAYVLDNQDLHLKEYLALIGIEITGDSPNNLKVNKMEKLSAEQEKLFQAQSKNHWT